MSIVAIVGADEDAVRAIARGQGLTIIEPVVAFDNFATMDDGSFGNLPFVHITVGGAAALASG
jgi:hypothetical protein